MELAKGQTTLRKLGITEDILSIGRSMGRVDQVRRLKELEREWPTDQALDLAILKEASSGNFARADGGRQWSVSVRPWECRSGGRVAEAVPIHPAASNLDTQDDW